MSYGFIDNLNYYKGKDDPTVAAAFMSAEKSKTDALIMVSLAWEKMDINTKSSSFETRPTWKDLWENVDFDPDDLVSRSGLDEINAMKCFEQLKGLRIIFPDGTVSGYAKNYIITLLMKEMNAGKKKKKDDSE